MKNLILTVTIFSSFVSPVFAGDLCREQAQQMGYIGATELLRPCHYPAPQVLSDAGRTTEKALVRSASNRLVKARSEKVSFELEDVYTQ